MIESEFQDLKLFKKFGIVNGMAREQFIGRYGEPDEIKVISPNEVILNYESSKDILASTNTISFFFKNNRLKRLNYYPYTG